VRWIEMTKHGDSTMTTFKVGQRVRIVTPGFPECDGKEGTIVRAWDYPHCPRIPDNRAGASWNVRLDCDFCNELRYFDDELRPLTDPRADAFIASVKSWGPLKEKRTYAELLDDVLAHIRGGSL
jgi:hypothetical protein